MKPEEQQDPNYRTFIEYVVQHRVVFSLQDQSRFYAECPSESYNNDLGEPEVVYCFWHTAHMARACQQEEWSDYQLVEINLADFMYETLIEMDKDQYLVGVSFDAELFGIEIEPIELLADLLDEIQAQHLVDEFVDFAELQRYRQQWEQISWQQQIIH